jgi:hypothetical protein
LIGSKYVFFLHCMILLVSSVSSLYCGA